MTTAGLTMVQCSVLTNLYFKILSKVLVASLASSLIWSVASCLKLLLVHHNISFTCFFCHHNHPGECGSRTISTASDRHRSRVNAANWWRHEQYWVWQHPYQIDNTIIPPLAHHSLATHSHALMNGTVAVHFNPEDPGGYVEVLPVPHASTHSHSFDLTIRCFASPLLSQL